MVTYQVTSDSTGRGISMLYGHKQNEWLFHHIDIQLFEYFWKVILTRKDIKTSRADIYLNIRLLEK